MQCIWFALLNSRKADPGEHMQVGESDMAQRLWKFAKTNHKWGFFSLKIGANYVCPSIFQSTLSTHWSLSQL